jgi:hypothetical protein
MNKLLLPACVATLVANAADPALTVYNQNFAVVRDTVTLDLKPGVNNVTFAGATAHLEPNSVVLRDPAGNAQLEILEQNYRNDPVSQEFLLSWFEGKTIDFEVTRHNQAPAIIPGKIIRSGYAAPPVSHQARNANPPALQPLIEIGGKLQFGLPGKPLFPSLPDDSVLKPALEWKLNVANAVRLDAQVAYLTRGMSWSADYNIVAPEQGDTVDITGWVTIDNQTGRTFENAKIKLMAGDVNRVEEEPTLGVAAAALQMSAPAVTEESFDEYHLYTLERQTTLRDRETKQVEFVHATGVKSQRIYTYDGIGGARPFDRHSGNPMIDPNYGTNSQPKVTVVHEFENTAANHLGIPLPEGRLRFYRQSNDSQLEFTGENTIDHTPKDETIRVFTGHAFDIVGERKRTNFRVNSNGHEMDEQYEIKIRNHKKEPVEVRVVEHLLRWHNWAITEKSADFTKRDSSSIEFRVPVKPDEERVVTYHVRYTW